MAERQQCLFWCTPRIKWIWYHLSFSIRRSACYLSCCTRLCSKSSTVGREIGKRIMRRSLARPKCSFTLLFTQTYSSPFIYSRLAIGLRRYHLASWHFDGKCANRSHFYALLKNFLEFESKSVYRTQNSLFFLSVHFVYVLNQVYLPHANGLWQIQFISCSQEASNDTWKIMHFKIQCKILMQTQQNWIELEQNPRNKKAPRQRAKEWDNIRVNRRDRAIARRHVQWFSVDIYAY